MSGLCSAQAIFLEIQWGSEIQPFEISKHTKSKFFEDWISGGGADS